MGTKWGRRILAYSESLLSNYGCLYTFASLYVITNILLFLREANFESSLHRNYRRYTTAIARGSGATINFNVAVVILLASRSLISLLRVTPLNMVLPLDKAMPDFHRLVGSLILIAGVIHTIFHIPMYAIDSTWSPGIKGTTNLFIVGIFLLALMLIIRLVAQPAVYHTNYELFFRTHVTCSVIFYALLVVHGQHRGDPTTWKWIIAPLTIYILDILLRGFREKRSYLLVSKHSAALQSNSILKIRLPRIFHHEAGQYAEIRVPRLSRFQWHPFTISSAPHEAEMTFYVKAVGDWTKSLYQLFATSLNEENSEDIEVHIRGPYGAPAQHVGQFDRVILVGGGVGATPFCSVVKDAYHWITHWTPQHLRRRQVKEVQMGVGQQPDQNVILQQREHAHGNYQSRAETINNRSSHLFTTNVFSERLLSSSSIGQDSLMDVPPFPDHILDNDMFGENVSLDNDRTTVGGTTMYTARDFISCSDKRSKSSSVPSKEARHHETSGHVERETTKRNTNTSLKGNVPIDNKNQNDTDEVRQVTQSYETSGGTIRRSLDFLTALASIHEMEGADELFSQSLNMMVTMSYGSARLVRGIQQKQLNREIQQGRYEESPIVAQGPLPGPQGMLLPTTDAQVNIFRSRRVMFLLFMHSVTVNMIILWLLGLRFTMAGAGYAFNIFQVFRKGILLYSIKALSAVDLTLATVLMLSIAIPCGVEVVELRSALLHGIDVFALTPMMIFEVMVGILGLMGIGQDMDGLFGIFHVFVLWPVLTVLLGSRLLRVIGERVTQAQNVQVSHTTTRAVDFFWTAPTGKDDQWLVGDLQRYTDLRQVRMHRYLTRMGDRSVDGGVGEGRGGAVGPQSVNVDMRTGVGQGQGEETTRRNGRVESEWPGVSSRRLGSLQTHFGRPDWDEIVNEIAQRCPNNSTIGVFFCGPHAMGRTVKEACMDAMRNSIVRGLQRGVEVMRGLEEIFGDAVSANEYTGEEATKYWTKQYDGGNPTVDTSRTAVGSRAALKSMKTGCNITIVFKKESFL